MLDKKPTVSLPSAREVLRTKVGDCNEHTALYVAMARAAGLPARIAVGLAYSAARSTTTRGPRSTSTRGAAAASGCPSIPPSTSFPPTRRTSA
jgi:transglutaminase-like putative cysteine protease